MVGLGITIFVLVYLGINLDQEHFPLKWFFILISIFLVLVTINSTTSLMEAENVTSTTLTRTIETGYSVMIWVIYLSLAYFMIMMLYNTLTMFRTREKK